MNHVKPESIILAVRIIVGSEARTLSGCMLGSIYQPAGGKAFICTCCNAPKSRSSSARHHNRGKTWHVRCSGSSVHILSSCHSQVCDSLWIGWNDD